MLGRAVAQLGHDLAAGLDHGHAGGEGGAAAAGEVGEADRVGVGDDRLDALVADAELLGDHHGQRGAACRRCRSSRSPRVTRAVAR